MLLQAVTTVWRTELGTTLSDGFNSTTDGSAYFHYLCFTQSAMNLRMSQVPLPYGPALRGRVASKNPAQRLRDIVDNVDAIARDPGGAPARCGIGTPRLTGWRLRMPVTSTGTNMELSTRC